MSILNPLYAKTIVLVGSILLILIPASLHRRSVDVKVVRSRKGPLETILLALALIGFLPSLVWVATPVLAFADYPLRFLPFIAGVACLALGLWCLYRSHAELGASWSITLEVRERHQLVTHGIYRHIRHPMYLALLLYSSGLALVIPNWVAGPSYLVALVILVALRLGPEERMMREEFGKSYEAYMARTRRLVPGIW